VLSLTALPSAPRLRWTGPLSPRFWRDKLAPCSLKFEEKDETGKLKAEGNRRHWLEEATPRFGNVKGESRYGARKKLRLPGQKLRSRGVKLRLVTPNYGGDTPPTRRNCSQNRWQKPQSLANFGRARLQPSLFSGEAPLERRPTGGTLSVHHSPVSLRIGLAKAKTPLKS
jgi:hypothetical protein